MQYSIQTFNCTVGTKPLTQSRQLLNVVMFHLKTIHSQPLRRCLRTEAVSFVVHLRVLTAHTVACLGISLTVSWNHLVMLSFKTPSIIHKYASHEDSSFNLYRLTSCEWSIVKKKLSPDIYKISSHCRLINLF